MSRIRGKDTTPEMRVRSLLHRHGYRFRLHVRIPIPAKTAEHANAVGHKRAQSAQKASLSASTGERVRVRCRTARRRRIVANGGSPNSMVTPCATKRIKRLIEVKTTSFGSLTPFFASRKEVDVSEARDDEYKLYRLFEFRKHPRLFMLNGALGHTCFLEPSLFTAMPK